jgi:hypothetical protein
VGTHLALQRRLDRLLDHVRQQAALAGQLDPVELRLLHQPSDLLAHPGRNRPRRVLRRIIDLVCHG